MPTPSTVLRASGAAILNRTAYGRYVQAIGSNEQVARYAAVDVDRIKLERVHQRNNDLWLPIDEDPDGFGGQTERFTNFPGVGGRNSARRFLVEIEPQRRSAKLNRQPRIIKAGR